MASTTCPKAPEPRVRPRMDRNLQLLGAMSLIPYSHSAHLPHPSNCPTVLPLRKPSILWISSRSYMLPASPGVSGRSPAFSGGCTRLRLPGLSSVLPPWSGGVPNQSWDPWATVLLGVTLSLPYRKDSESQRRHDMSPMSQLVAAMLGANLSLPLTPETS